LIRFGNFNEARKQLMMAEQIAPETKRQVDQIRSSYGLR
jgi:hypothetical protein